MSDAYSRLLADYAIEAEGGTAEALHEAKRRILDTLGVMYAAISESTVRRFFGYGEIFPVSDASSLFHVSLKVTPDTAALVNGVAARYLDFNDTYLSKEPLHPSDMIPGLLALAEWRRLSGQALLDAIVVAYEVGVNLCDAASLRSQGWDHVSYIAIATACGASRLLGLSPQQTEHAISIACLPHVACRQTRAGELSNWKGAAAANAVRNALVGTLLASQGVTGPYAPFEGEMGFFRQALGGERFDEGALTTLRERLPAARILDTHIKGYPVEYHAQSVVDISRELHRKIGNPANIEHIQIDTFKASYEIIAKDPEKWRPKTRETADHSIQYITAIVLLDGDVTQASFASEKLTDPTVVDWLTNRMSLEEKPDLTEGYPDGIPNRVTVTTRDGERHVKELKYPRGHSKNPMTDNEVIDKFHRNAARAIYPDATRELVETVMSIDELGDLGELTRRW